MNISEIKNINKLKEYRQFYIDLQNKLNELSETYKDSWALISTNGGVYVSDIGDKQYIDKEPQNALAKAIIEILKEKE